MSRLFANLSVDDLIDGAVLGFLIFTFAFLVSVSDALDMAL